MAGEPTWPEVARLIEHYGDASEVALAERVRELRLRHDPPLPTPEDLAQRFDGRVRLDRAAIWKIENPDKPGGGRKLSVAEALALAKALDVTIADLLLPDDALQEVDGWSYFMNAGEALNAVRHAWNDYTHAIDVVRLRMKARPELTGRIRAYRKDAEKRFEEQWRPVWENDHEGNLSSESEFKAFLRDQLPTPARIVADDALDDGPLRSDHWAMRSKARR